MDSTLLGRRSPSILEILESETSPDSFQVRDGYALFKRKKKCKGCRGYKEWRLNSSAKMKVNEDKGIDHGFKT